MTDNEIIKALECCIKGNCDECPAYAMNCGAKVPMAFALDLINRQKAESDRLDIELKAMRGAANSYKAEVERLAQEKDNLIKTYKECVIEAIKDFADGIQRHCTSIELNAYIDTLVEEMVGDETND